MAARPNASATISFGLVSVPVQLYPASESQASVSFNWITTETGARLKQQYVDAKTGDKVEKEDMIKGYEFEKGRYVTFTPDEIKAMEEKGTGSIDIVEFVPLDKVDRLYFDRGYFLGPGKGGDRAYRLLSAALKKADLAAIGQYAARGKQYLIMLRPLEGGLVLEQMHYADEVRSMKEVPLPEGDVKPAELNLAMQLIEGATTDAFKPEKYKDTVRDRMLEQIQQKAAGEEIVMEPAAEPQAQVIDLMEALKQSLAKGGVKKAAAAAAKSEMKAVRGKSAPTKKTKIARRKTA